MKRKARLALLGALLHGGTHAAELSGQSAPVASESLPATTPSTKAPAKQLKAVRNKKAAKPPVKTEPAAAAAQSGVAGTEGESADQSVQIKGVRG
jgi:hypothetical protein